MIEQKYDGIRVNCIFYNKDNIKFFSRKGKEIKTLDFLKPSILKLNLPNNTVIDGEICDIRNGQENFSSIVSYIHKGVKKWLNAIFVEKNIKIYTCMTEPLCCTAEIGTTL